MIKRTLYFGNPAYLSIKLDQLLIKKPNEDETISIPIEDIGMVLLDHAQITLTHDVIRRLQNNKAAIISCNSSHIPQGLMLPLEGNYTQTLVQKNQIAASEALKKNLWKQTIVAKIRNQKLLLLSLGKSWKQLEILQNRVKSGDAGNDEAQAARIYWSKMFEDFTRDRYGDPPNHWLNYGYIILRSMMARALVSSGLLPTLGVFHKNKYNAFGLADDIMEPFRPFVDKLVYEIYMEEGENHIISKTSKQKLLSLATMDAQFSKQKRPLMVGMAMTTQSLSQCFAGTRRNIIYPSLI